MSPIQKDIEQKMDEAFAAGPGSAEERDLLKFLTEHPEYHPLWKEYQTLRRGMILLKDQTGPSEITRARIQRLSREHLQKTAHTGRGWRWLLSQPVVAAATVLLVVGFGIYSQYLLKEEKRLEQTLPATEKLKMSTPEAAPPAPVSKPNVRSVTQPPPPVPAKKKAAEPKPNLFQTPTDAGTAGGAGFKETAKDEAPSEKAPAALERERQQESEGAVAPGAAPVAAPELKAQRAAPPSSYDRLLAQAKDKIASGDCPAAMKLLLEAQKLENTEEVRNLIHQCEHK